ncbi:unnamed protein product [Urochloa decumbens]|uniref:Pectinesterase inhibitor domain-containing protein n=1 Tax=Urochloa decumbens TaxID=240449 RepID=A0ABC9FQB9_9POAL
MATTTSMASFSYNRKSTAPLIRLLSILFAASVIYGEPPSVVPSACKRAYGVGGGSFTEEFCLSALTGHSVGAADNADLALFTVDLAAANATATEAKIDTLLGGSGAASEGLRSCRALYDAAVHVYLPDSHAAVKDGKYVDAKLYLSKTAQVPVECERWFKQRNVASPVDQEDDNLAKLANLAIALTSIA